MPIGNLGDALKKAGFLSDTDVQKELKKDQDEKNRKAEAEKIKQTFEQARENLEQQDLDARYKYFNELYVTNRKLLTHLCFAFGIGYKEQVLRPVIVPYASVRKCRVCGVVLVSLIEMSKYADVFTKAVQEQFKEDGFHSLEHIGRKIRGRLKERPAYTSPDSKLLLCSDCVHNLYLWMLDSFFTDKGGYVNYIVKTAMEKANESLKKN